MPVGMSNKAAAVLMAVSLTLVARADGHQLPPVRVIPLPDARGRLDHMDYDAARTRLYIAAHDAGKLIVVDTARGSAVSEVAGLKEPQGVIYDSMRDRVLVTNGGDGSVAVFNGPNLAPSGTVRFTGDADNVRLDTASGIAYIGYGDGGIGIVRLKDLTIVGNIKLGGHPEAYALDGKRREIYANIPALRSVAVIDMTSGRVARSWKLSSARDNYALALNADGRELFVGCREPAVILVLDADTGRVMQTIGISADVDDLYYDPASRRVYASCGAGFIHVLSLTGPHRYMQLARLSTRAGARTSLLVPSTSQLFVALPGTKNEGAGVMVYDIRGL